MDSKGVFVAEALTTANSTSALKNWVGASYDYFLFRTSPKNLIVTDMGSDMVGYPTLPVIDLQTMEVLQTTCYYEDWESCVEKFL